MRQVSIRRALAGGVTLLAGVFAGDAVPVAQG